MKKIIVFALIFVITITSIFAVGKGISATFGFTFQGNGSSTDPTSIKDNFFRSTVNFGLDYNVNEMFSFGVITKTKYHPGYGVGVSDVTFNALAFIRFRGNLGKDPGCLGFYGEAALAGLEIQVIDGTPYPFYTIEISTGWDLRITNRCLVFAELGIQAVDYTNYPGDKGYVSVSEANKGGGFLGCAKTYGEMNIGLRYFL